MRRGEGRRIGHQPVDPLRFSKPESRILSASTISRTVIVVPFPKGARALSSRL